MDMETFLQSKAKNKFFINAVTMDKADVIAYIRCVTLENMVQASTSGEPVRELDEHDTEDDDYDGPTNWEMIVDSQVTSDPQSRLDPDDVIVTGGCNVVQFDRNLSTWFEEVDVAVFVFNYGGE
jgi:hypothetical protein